MMGRLVGAVAIVSLWAASAHAEKDRYDVGEAIPSFTLKAVNGEDVGESYINVENYFGATAKDPKKAILLSFFATYCEPCKREMPLLAAMYDQYKSKGLQIMLVSIDKEAEKIDEAKTLAKAAGVKFPVLSDRFNIVAKRFFISKLPNVYLLNGEGKVAMVNVGYNDDISRGLVDEVRKLLGEPTSEPIPAAISKHMGHGSAASVPAQGATASADTVASAQDDDDDAKGKGKGKAKAKAKGKKK